VLIVAINLITSFQAPLSRNADYWPQNDTGPPRSWQPISSCRRSKPMGR
jgi:hypothetical protein